ncbi:virion structural protein [Cellulophaga phage phi18:3]|uniref:Structural protein n=1 Tax=Cellulophaga phage phi18:3 TaxID=1327983 RepID=R9ZZ53_9CAUD|nr:virion structural protein [Cellulophaga phage phi18:3]AGO48624.1 structural protein [Cellulophaga phage phi18:3]
MAYLIDRIYSTVKFFVNTDVRGNVKPSDFDKALFDAIQGRNEEYFSDISRFINKQNRGLMPNFLENLADRFREKVNHYLVDEEDLVLVSGSTNKYVLPENYRYIDEISIAGTTSFEECKSSKEFNIVKTLATTQYPALLKVGNTIKIYPETTETVSITYLRTVNYPKWTNVVVNGTALFNPSASDFSDADIHPSEEFEITRRVLLSFGINLKEQDIQQVAMAQENTDFNQDNAS